LERLAVACHGPCQANTVTENLNVTGVYHTVCSKLGPGAIFFLMFENFLAGENLRLHFLPQYWSKLRSEKNRGIHAPVSSRKLGEKRQKWKKIGRIQA